MPWMDEIKDITGMSFDDLQMAVKHHDNCRDRIMTTPGVSLDSMTQGDIRSKLTIPGQIRSGLLVHCARDGGVHQQ